MCLFVNLFTLVAGLVVCRHSCSLVCLFVGLFGFVGCLLRLLFFVCLFASSCGGLFVYFCVDGCVLWFM